MTDLHDLLARVAASAPPTGPDLASVRRRARRIRRRRTAVAAGGICTIIALVAAVGVAVASGGDQHAASPVGSSSTASPSPGPLPQDGPGTPPRTTPVIHVLEKGAPVTDDSLGVAYWHAGALHAPDGTTTPQPTRPTAFAALPGGGWIVDTGHEVDAIGADGVGDQVDTPSFPQGVATGSDGSVAYLFGLSGQVHVRLIPATGPAATYRLPTDVRQARVDAVLTGHRVVVDTDPGGTEIVDPDAGTVEPLGWATTLDESASGRYVATAHRRGSGSSALTLRHPSTQKPVVTYLAPKNGFFGGYAWDGDRLLAAVFEPAPPLQTGLGPAAGHWFLALLGPDGYSVVRGTAVAGEAEVPAYVLANG